MSDESIHFLANIGGTGYHDGGWQEPGLSGDAFLDIEHYQRIADVAERGLIDAILIPDMPTLALGGTHRPPQSLEPTLLCAALAVTTTHVGFLPTLSTSYNDPYNLARRVLSLDHASGGRAGWNLVTSANPQAAANFGLDEPVDKEIRYRRAGEFVRLSEALWDSWEDGALIGDQAEGVFADPDRIHAVGHAGEFFQVEGPLNVPRSPQGRPVTAQAGASDAGMRFAAAHSEIVYGSQMSLSGAIEFAERMRELAAEVGRDPGELRFMPALVPVVGTTDAEAEMRWDELQSKVRVAGGEAARLEAQIWVAPGTLGDDLDAPLDPAIFNHRHEGFSRAFARFVADTGMSARELARNVQGGHRLVIGSPQRLADHIEEWWRSGAIDGFTLAPPAAPHDLARFVDLVVPELQRRGIYRRAYPGTTLRDNLGIPVPANCFNRSPEIARDVEGRESELVSGESFGGA